MLQLAKTHPRYPKYRPTNIDWIGDIPDGWEARKMKTVIENHTGGTWGDDPLGDENDLPCVRVADFDYQKLSVVEEITTFRNIQKNQQDKKLISSGTILLEKSGGGEKTPVGRVVKYNSENIAVCSNFVEKIELKSLCNPDFFTYLNYSAYSTRLTFKSINQTTGIQNIDLYSYFSEKIPCPSIQEQQKIAIYLDDKTALIDEAIAKKQHQIELLSEHRTALINNAITKGLDPNAEMKDSGLKWVGNINKNWLLEPLKRLVEIKITDGPHTTPDFVEDDENTIPFISAEAIKDSKIDFNYRRGNISPELHKDYCQKCYPRRDDIFLVKSGSTTGKVAMVEVDFEFSVWSPLALVRANTSIALPKFLFYAMSSKIFQNQVQLFWSFGTQPNIGMGVIETLIIPVPSIREQKEIVDYLDKEVLYIEAMKEKIQHSINLLQEYKTSLISHVVSGKIKVS